MSDQHPEVRRLGSISFKYEESEDRILCIGIPAGVATGHIVMWMTNRLGYQFLSSAHAKRPDKDDHAEPEGDDAELQSMVDYGYTVEQARRETEKGLSRGDPKAKAPLRHATWLIRKIQVQKKDDMINLILIGNDDAAGFTLSSKQFLRIVDMLEEAFKAANWVLPDRSYSNMGSKLAEASGQRLN